MQTRTLLVHEANMRQSPIYCHCTGCVEGAFSTVLQYTFAKLAWIQGLDLNNVPDSCMMLPAIQSE